MSKYFFILIIFSIIACNGKQGKPPIKENEMAKILVDVHVAESVMQELPISIKKDSIGKIYYSKIFKIHKVTAADFDRSMKIYQKNPAQMERLYKRVIEELEKQDTEAHQ